MTTDSQLNNLPETFCDFTFINEAPRLTPEPEQSPYLGYGLEIGDTSLSIGLDNYVVPLSPDLGTLVQSVSNKSAEIECLDDNESDSIFKFLDQILMEENMEEKHSMFHDPLALQATEKSFYDVIDKKYPPSPSIDYSADLERTWETNGNSYDPLWIGDPEDYDFPTEQFHSSDGSIQSSFENYSGGQVDSCENLSIISSLFRDSESTLQIREGVEEARKFLPTNSGLVVDLDNNTLVPNPEIEPPKVEVKNHFPCTRGRKHLDRQNSDLDTRSRKQSAVYVDEVELSDLFDKVLLRDVEGVRVTSKGDVKFVNGIEKYFEQNVLQQVPRNLKVPNKKKGKESNVVDLQSLLLSCAQAVASDDLRTAGEQLKQIRQYASSTGAACQRVANVFADGLEARMAGTGSQMYTALASKRISATENIRAYQVYLSACPFKEIAIIYSNKIILQVAAKASTLHIVDFGIFYGFQWPVLIQFLSLRRGGPPKLRITGIDFPQPGFRPAKLIEETGERLAKYCKRFNVPFEYQAIASQSWETINIDNLKLVRDEVLVVNCMLQLKNLSDETLSVESPKDGVLKLIRRMKPDVFIHSIVNGSYNAPFFMTRFRDAFFYYSSMFDMFDVTLPQDDLQRLHFEREFFGREVVNIIACEGQQRIIRPETYKQWQVRNMRAGFKILPLDNGTVEKLKGRVEAGFHKDFLLYEDCNWMLQGWRGRVLYGSSCWVPA